jgi:tetratricopeptide (TPR) repeat protein
MIKYIIGALVLLGLNSCSILGDINLENAREAYSSGEYPKAIGYFQEALNYGTSQLGPEEIYTMMGNTYNAMDQLEKALEYHEKALDINPNFHNALVNKGIVHRLRGEYDKAEESYKKALWIEPNYPELHASLGALYIVQDQAQAAVDALEKAILLDNTLPVAHSNLAIALAMLGRFDEAEKAILTAEGYAYPNGAIIRQRIEIIRQELTTED